MAYSIKADWDGPTRKAVPRRRTNDSRSKVVGRSRLGRKAVNENRYGGSGWEPSKVYKNKY